MNVNAISAGSPALARYAEEVLFDRVWQRSGLSPRDRSIVTLAAVVTRGQRHALAEQMRHALDHGVTPRELSEIVTHLAFYAGWYSGVDAAIAAGAVFSERGIGADQLPPASPRLLPLDHTAEDNRARTVEQSVGPIAPNLVKDTGEVLFRELWLRPDLAPRDRSVVTVAALITGGHFAQVTYRLGRAMDNGLSRGEASEIVSHLAYYAGWPNAFSAVQVVKGVFDSRTD